MKPYQKLLGATALVALVGLSSTNSNASTALEETINSYQTIPVSELRESKESPKLLIAVEGIPSTLKLYAISSPRHDRVHQLDFNLSDGEGTLIPVNGELAVPYAGRYDEKTGDINVGHKNL